MVGLLKAKVENLVYFCISYSAVRSIAISCFTLAWLPRFIINMADGGSSERFECKWLYLAVDSPRNVD